MLIQYVRHDLDHGWSGDLPDLDSRRTLVLVFGAPEYFDRTDALLELLDHYPTSTFAGCSTAGEIHGIEVTDASLSVAVVQFDNTMVKFAATPITGTTSRESGVELAEQLRRDDLSAMLVLSDGLEVNGSHLVEGIVSAVGPGVGVSGGLAGDGDRFERTWTLVDGKPTVGFVTGVGLYGDSVKLGYGSQGGWDFFGPTRKITRSRDNVLYELDGKPALDLYKTYLGDLAAGLPATGLRFPLAVDLPDGDTVVRTILAVDEATNSLTYAGEIPQGATARLMQASLERLIDGAEGAGATAASDESTLCMAISCVGRRLVMGERVEEETEAVMDQMTDGTVLVGFYSYGEIAQSAGDMAPSFSSCQLHNQTMTITTISED